MLIFIFVHFQFSPNDVDAEAEEVVNELQLLTENMSNKENEQNDWRMLQMKLVAVYILCFLKSFFLRFFF